MRVEPAAVALAILLFSLAACNQSDRISISMEVKQTYSLCPKYRNVERKLYEQVKHFADQQKAKLIDRGDEAQQELSKMRSSVLTNTSRKVILLTVERPGEFRISVTNLGLNEKIALAVRHWGKVSEDNPVSELMNDLDRSWTVKRVDGNVTNEPHC